MASLLSLRNQFVVGISGHLYSILQNNSLDFRVKHTRKINQKFQKSPFLQGRVDEKDILGKRELSRALIPAHFPH